MFAAPQKHRTRRLRGVGEPRGMTASPHDLARAAGVVLIEDDNRDVVPVDEWPYLQDPSDTRVTSEL